jgi:hypothetical protein
LKAKIILLLATVVIIAGGIGVWFALRPNNQPLSNNNQTSEQKNIPRIELNITNENLELAQKSKTLEVSVRTDGYDKIAKIEYLLNGKVVARSIEPPFEVSINLAQLEPGEHTIQAIAYGTNGGKAQSEVFTFELKADDEVAPADDDSESIVRQSRSSASQPSSASLAGSSSSGGSSSGGSGDSSGGSSGGGDGNVLGTRTSGGWWASLPAGMQVCSNNGWNGGPSTAPDGAITVPAGSNAGFSFNQDNKVFWFAPGVHTLQASEFSSITAGDNSTYIGAPGAILDGANANRYAFIGNAANVTIKYLEIRNFGRGNDNNNEGVINHDSGTNWVMEHLYAHHNDGAAIFLGSENTVRYNCMKDNGQYGFSMYKPPILSDSAIKNIVIDQNEISGNNQDDWEAQIPGCGCSGAGKFWDVQGATVTNNYVHDNLSTGLWADTNDIDFLFDSNWIEHNEGEGIWYEISYNATISRNVIKRNAWTSGQNNTGSPGPAIYISESGGDSRLASTVSGSTDLQIKNNLIEDNFSGISIFENANRFCNSNGNTSKGYCTPFVTPTIISEPHDFTYPNPISTTHPCYTQITTAPYIENCRWHSQNVQVFNNEFRFTEANVPCAGTYCGVQALIATGADNIPWDPADYNVANVQNDVMFNNDNKFYNNTYHGNWRFAKGFGEKIFYDTWQAGPYLQDSGSTFDGLLGPPPVTNSLDTNTATLETNIGQWVQWFNVTAARSTADAHSGTASLLLTATGGNGAANVNNYPGFDAGPGPKNISFWAKRGSGSIATATMIVKWFNSSQQQLQSNSIPLTLSTSWQQATNTTITAPAGTTTVFVELHTSSGSAGNTVFADDFVVGDQM